MKKINAAILFIFIFKFSYGQIINIPDPNFKSRLVSTNCAQLTSPAWLTDVDTNNDGEIQLSEAANVLKLNVSTNEFNTISNLFSLEGLAYFTNLTELNCKGNSLLALDVSAAPNLKILECSYNQLTNLALSGLSNLEDLRCNKNQLTQLNISGLTNLKLIFCIYNNLTQVNLSGLTALQNFQCDANQISNLTLQNNNALVTLSVSQNLINSIDLQSCPNLSTLWASNNGLTSLNLFGLNSLNFVDVNSNLLTAIDASQTPLLNQLFCSNNPNLTAINIRNSYQSYGDPDLLFFPFRFDDLPNILTICLDDGEQNYLPVTLINSNTGVQIFGGPNCTIPLEINTNSTSDFDLKNNVFLYPNPVSNTIIVQVTNGLSTQSITIYNALGQLIKTVTDNNINISPSIDVSGLKSGMYFMEINSTKGKVTKIFVKN